jgi:hypothetical protein
MTLAVVGEIAMVIVDAALLPQPTAPNIGAAIRIRNEKYFHRFMPVLPRTLDLQSIRN